MNTPVFALIDCNNFFVSCERIFRADLEGKPVVVLSSNDGCAVARSNEAKALGIPMGAPAFKYRQLFKDHKVVQFSANFELYGDISRRITELLISITPRTEVYSVDESFLDLGQLGIKDYTAWGRSVRKQILRWTGIPVSVSIAPTKTLAKLASDRAKKDQQLGGVLSLKGVTLQTLQKYLAVTPVQDIWGIGGRLAPKVRAEGINDALQLASMRPQRLQQMIGIHGRQLIAELNGTSCYPLEPEGKVRKSIARTRTFGSDTSEAHVVEAALASFTAQAAYRLRSSHQLTRHLSIFLTTDKHKPGYRSWTEEATFPTPTADTGLMAVAATELFGKLRVPGVRYHRAGVLLYDFVPDGLLQTDLLGNVNVDNHDNSIRRMRAVDSLNDRFGKRTIRLAAEGLGKAWEPKHNLRSPRYTSRWQELAKVKLHK